MQPCRLDEKWSLLSLPHLLNFSPAHPLLPTLTRCASHRTPCWLQRALPRRGRWESALCRSASPEIRNALLLLPSFSSLMAHTKLTGRSVALRKLPPTSPEARDYVQIPCICLFPPIFLHLSSKGEGKQSFYTTLIWFFRRKRILLQFVFHITSSHSWADDCRKGPVIDPWAVFCHEISSITTDAC